MESLMIHVRKTNLPADFLLRFADVAKIEKCCTFDITIFIYQQTIISIFYFGYKKSASIQPRTKIGDDLCYSFNPVFIPQSQENKVIDASDLVDKQGNFEKPAL